MQVEILELMQVEMISWKTYIIMKFSFDIVGFKEQMKICKFTNLIYQYDCCCQFKVVWRPCKK
jgi:hypothetical protein